LTPASAITIMGCTSVARDDQLFKVLECTYLKRDVQRMGYRTHPVQKTSRTKDIPYKRHLVQKTSRTEHLLLHAGKNAVVQETRLNPGPVELLHHMLNSGDQQSKDSRPSSNPLLGKHVKWKEEFDMLNNWGSHVLPLFVFPSVCVCVCY
jgi:hypothetical protein